MRKIICRLRQNEVSRTFHRAIINTVGYTRHTLHHTGIFQHLVKGSIGVLETTVTVKQWMCVWIGLHSSFECVEHNRVVVAVTNNIRNDTSVIQIEGCTQIDFVDFNTFIPFELCNIGKPFHIWLWCMKATVYKGLQAV